MTDKLIEELTQTKDMQFFRRYVSSLDDINKNLIETSDDCLNLLHICIGFDESEFSLECIEYLLSFATIDINALAKISGTLGITGAHIAVDWSHYRVLNILIQFGINLFVCDSYGRTALDYAVERQDERTQLMIEKAVQTLFHVFDSNDLIQSNTQLNSNCSQTLLKDKINSKPKFPNETDLDKTIEYFDENKNLWKNDDKSYDSYHSDDKSGDSLISNISYEKTESVKSFCSDKTETYVYKDRDHQIVLIEDRIHGSFKDSQNISKGYVTQSSDDQYIKDIELMNATQIFNELRSKGDSPGPILPSTRKYYQKRLLNIRRGTLSPSKVLPLPNHSPELNLLVENKFSFDKVLELEKEFFKFFDEKHCKQNNFIYLLIDPNISENIPLQANSTRISANCWTQLDINLFTKFIKSIFYVGKGQGNRVYQHFYEAIKSDVTQQMCPKVKRIHEIWSSNKGVTSLHCFHNISSSEALTREAMIIEALHLSNLTNQVNGQYTKQLKWNEKKRKTFGSYLLFKSYKIHVLTGERQIRRPTN